VWGGEETQQALVYDPHHREQLWRFLTYMLLHSDSLHLALNIAIQCLLAAPLEHEQGHLRTSLVYLGGVLGGRSKVSLQYSLRTCYRCLNLRSSRRTEEVTIIGTFFWS
jgi:membrane associated rhomboid family serine protease